MTMMFGVVLVLVALTLFRTGRITSDKMEMQNAADAIAYSMSTIEARDLNFAAYTNRAIVANEVAMGQALGMASWAHHWESIGDFLQEYDTYLATPTLGISTTIITPMATGFRTTGTVFMTIMDAYAKVMTAVNTNVNLAYGIAQQIYHLAAVVNTLGMIDEMIQKNAPDNTQMSGYGVLMLLAHLGTYGGLPLPGVITSQDAFAPFTKSYNPTSKETKEDWQADTAGETDAGGYGRLAAIIQDSGDPFTKGRQNPPYHDNPDYTGRGWEINLFKKMEEAGLLPAPISLGVEGPPVSGYMRFGVWPDGWLGFEMGGGFDTPIGGFSIDYYIKIQFTMKREGGSELRAVMPVTGNPQVGGTSFAWSSADATNFELGFAGGGGFEAWITIPIIDQDITIIDIGFDILVDNDHMFIGFSFGGSESGCHTTQDEDGNDVESCETVAGDADVSIYDGPFPNTAPIGAAFVQSGSTANKITTPHLVTEATGGPVSEDSYGKAAARLLARYYPTGPQATGIVFQPSDPRYTDVVSTSHKGLPRYIDTTGSEPLAKMGGPLLIVGLQMGEDDFDTAHYDDHGGAEPAGQFTLDEAFGAGDMTAIAKSEVYFDRPLDRFVDYFARSDGHVEHGSAFNPYWQARLIETSHADRVLALLVEHGEVAQTITFGEDIDSLVDWLAGLLP